MGHDKRELYQWKMLDTTRSRMLVDETLERDTKYIHILYIPMYVCMFTSMCAAVYRTGERDGVKLCRDFLSKEPCNIRDPTLLRHTVHLSVNT